MLTGVHESTLLPEPQLCALSEALGVASRFYGPEMKTKQTPVCKINESLPQGSHRQTWVACEVDSRCFLCEKERRTSANDFGLLPV